MRNLLIARRHVALGADADIVARQQVFERKLVMLRDGGIPGVLNLLHGRNARRRLGRLGGETRERKERRWQKQSAAKAKHGMNSILQLKSYGPIVNCW